MNAVDKKLTQVATDIYSRIKQASGESLDPITILTIIYILTKLITMLIDWYTDTDKAVKALDSLGFVKRWILWRTIREKVNNKKQARHAYYAFIEQAESMSVEEKKQLLRSYISLTTKKKR